MAITRELKRKVRLQKAEPFELADGLFKLKIAPCTANRSLGLAENAKGARAGVDLVMGGCITEAGDPYFTDDKEALEFLETISGEDLARLMKAITRLSKPKADSGNSEASPADS